jgi:hypothetical protein
MKISATISHLWLKLVLKGICLANLLESLLLNKNINYIIVAILLAMVVVEHR